MIRIPSTRGSRHSWLVLGFAGLVSLHGAAACGSSAGNSGAGGALSSVTGSGGSGTGVGGSGCAEPNCVPFDPSTDYAELTKDVHSLESGEAAPSAMVVYGPTAFPVVLDGDSRAFVAAARVGNGRVVAYAHEAFLAGGFDGADDRATLATNAVRWASQKASPVVGLGPGLELLAKHFATAGLTTVAATPTAIAGVDVFVTSTYEPVSEQGLAAVQAFVAEGGGLITGGQAWSSSGGVVAYPGNRLLHDAGIVVTLEVAGIGKSAVDSVIPGPLLHAGNALERLAAHVTGKALLPLPEQEIGSKTVSFAVDVLPIGVEGFFDKAQAILAASPPPVPTEAAPFKPAGMPVAALELHIQSKLAKELPAAKVAKHEAAKDFPGDVPPNTPTVKRVLSVDASFAGREAQFAFSGAGAAVWRSTGLYAAPGATVHVEVDAAAVGKGLGVQVGAHTDALWHLDAWPRFPSIERWDALDAAKLDVASAFGGPIYVTVPPGAALGLVQVTIDGAVEAPRYVHGTTTIAEWKTLRDAPAPWAELESSKFAITVPSSTIRKLDDPSAVMTLWDQVLDADADLAAIPRLRPRAERFVTDREIGAGYLHSGYPIMAHLDGAPMVLDVDAIKKDGSWGPFHELGHNHQWIDWVLPGTVEASVNLWSVYASEEVLAIPRGKAHPALTAAERQKRIDDYVKGGADFSTWEVWTALETYLQLQEGFGWAPFKQVFADYRAIPPAEAPMDDAARINEWALRFSKAVNKDLGPFFLAWGFPLSAGVKAQLAALPAWAENPMKK